MNGLALDEYVDYIIDDVLYSAGPISSVLIKAFLACNQIHEQLI